MSPPVKRTYSSTLRAAQARETRRTVVAAASRLFEEHGFAGTTVDDIAQAAGVSRKTVFTAVGGKADLLKLALDWAVVGDDEPVALAERPQVKQLMRASDPDTLVRGWVELAVGISARTARLSRALMVAAALDPAARAHWDKGQGQRHEGARAFVAHLARQGGLRPGLTLEDAAEIAWVHNDAAVYHRLVVERGWPVDRFADWLARTLTLQLHG